MEDLSQKPDYMNERVFCRNRLPPRAYFLPEQTLLLSGRWRFHLASSPLDAAPKPDDLSSWTHIDVPGHLELQGFGYPHYTNFIFPFPVDVPHIPSQNPTGHYETSFAVPEDWNFNGGFEYRLRFEGVDSAYHLFVNGVQIGYNQGSRNAAEFDISKVIRSGKNETNTLYVKMYKWSDGSYIEDQDMWWLSGIFRDVYLLAFPRKAHIEDFFVRTSFDRKMENATLEIDITPRLEFAVELTLELLDSRDKPAAPIKIFELGPNNDTVTCAMKVTKPLKWTAERPNLYKLFITISANTTVFQRIEQNIGFRIVEIKDGLLQVNGTPILLKGTNRHDHHPRLGRAVPLDFIRHDLIQMKQHNFNALRCSHYPNDPRLLSIADEIGLYVLDEADLECHGMGVDWDHLPSATPSWEGAYLARMQQLVHRDKNHPSVIMWSLGNESWYGENHQTMYKWSKSYDKTRPVHYENDHEFRASDVISYMYLSIEDLIREATQDGDEYEKPVILQEYLHAMGNGPGAAKEYVEAFRKYRRLQGGFIWEWANHGIEKKLNDGSGTSFYAYGGDFGDEPNDGNFVMDGLCDSEHLPGPGLIELKSAYQPVSVSLENDGDKVDIRIENLFDFDELDDFECLWTLRNFSPSGPESLVESQLCSLNGVKPSQTKTIATVKSDGWKSSAGNAETWLSVSIRTNKKTLWADAGHEISSRDVCLDAGTGPALPLVRSLQSPRIKASARLLDLKTSSFAVNFDLIEAKLKTWEFQGRKVSCQGLGPHLTFWRAPTDNDKGGGGQLGEWTGARVQEMTEEIRFVKHELNPKTGALEVLVKSYFAPPVITWGFFTTSKYTFHSDGKVLITVKATPKGPSPDTIPRIGFEMTLPKHQTHCEWFGLGPGQTYRDMKLAGKVGVWKLPVDKMSHLYEMPQETGNHTETRWVKVTDERGNGIRAVLRQDDPGLDTNVAETRAQEQNTCQKGSDFPSAPSSPLDKWEHVRQQLPSESNSRKGFDFAVSRYTAQELDRAQHPYDLQESEGIVFRIDADHHGLGTASCGPGVRENYKLKTREFNFTVSLEPVRG